MMNGVYSLTSPASSNNQFSKVNLISRVKRPVINDIRVCGVIYHQKLAINVQTSLKEEEITSLTTLKENTMVNYDLPLVKL